MQMLPPLIGLWAVSGACFVFYLMRALRPAPPAPVKRVAPSAPPEAVAVTTKLKGKAKTLRIVGFLPNGDKFGFELPAELAARYPKRGFALGRDFWLADFVVKEEHLSKRHVRIIFQDDRFLIEDLNALNRTAVNGVALEPFKPQALSNGDRLKFGRLEATATVRNSARDDEAVNVADYRVITIGRGSANDFVLQNESASRRHAELVVTGHSQYFLMDCASVGGTLVHRDGEWRSLGADYVLEDEWLAFAGDADIVQVANILAQTKGAKP